MRVLFPIVLRFDFSLFSFINPTLTEHLIGSEWGNTVEFVWQTEFKDVSVNISANSSQERAMCTLTFPNTGNFSIGESVCTFSPLALFVFEFVTVSPGGLVFHFSWSRWLSNFLLVINSFCCWFRQWFCISLFWLTFIYCFCYLWHIITDDGRSETEMKNRIGIAKGVFKNMKGILTSRAICLLKDENYSNVLYIQCYFS